MTRVWQVRLLYDFPIPYREGNIPFAMSEMSGDHIPVPCNSEFHDNYQDIVIRYTSYVPRIVPICNRMGFYRAWHRIMASLAGSCFQALPFLFPDLSGVPLAVPVTFWHECVQVKNCTVRIPSGFFVTFRRSDSTQSLLQYPQRYYIYSYAHKYLKEWV